MVFWLFVLGALYLLVIPAIAWIAYRRSATLEVRVRQLEELHETVQILERKMSASRGAEVSTEPMWREQETYVPPPEEAVPDLPEVQPQPPVTSAPESHSTTSKPIPHVAVDKSKSPLSGVIAWFMQGNPLAKLGVFLLFFGVAYLLKYAADRDMLPIEIRLAGTGALGAGLLAIGWRLRHKAALYGLILQGGAVGIMYLTSFAASSYLADMPYGLVFGLMIVVCAASVALAVLQSAQSLAVLAALGGYLAPVLLSTGSGNFVGLFSYYAMLSMGILAVSVWQSWRPLNLVGFTFSFGVALLWGYKSYTPDNYLICQLFLVFNLVLYGVLAVVFALKHQHAGKGFVDGTLVFGTPLIGFGLQASMTRHWEFGAAFSALAFAAFYIPVARYLMKRWPAEAQRLYVSFLALGVAFVTLAILLALSAQWTAMAWALEGLGLLWAGRLQRQPRMAWSGTALLVASAVAAKLANDDGLGIVSFLTIGSVLSLSWIAGARLWTGEGAAVTGRIRGWDLSAIARGFLLLGGIAGWLWLVMRGADRLVEQTSPSVMVWLAVIGATALAWRHVGLRLKWAALQHCAWLLWPVAAVALATLVLVDGRALGSGLWSLLWLPALAVMVYLLRADAPALSSPVLPLPHIGLVWLLLALVGSEVWHHTEHMAWGMGEWRSASRLAFCGVAVLVVSWLNRQQRWPVATYPQVYWSLGLLPVIPVALLLLMLGNALDGQLPNMPYIPLINPLEQSAVFVLLMLLAWLRRMNSLVPIPPSAYRAASVVWGVLVVWWFNGMLLRSLAATNDVHWSAAALWDSRVVQAGMALAWTLGALACMHWATRQKHRKVWVGGALLLGAVILKLFLVDSAKGGGLERAIAFIGVALLVLLIGYIAPMPPKPKKESEL